MVVGLGALFASNVSAAEITVDKEKKAVIIEAKVAPRKVLAEVYPIEVIACFPHPRGKKAHETVVTIEAKPSDIHKALESLDLKPGKPADVPNDKPSEGPELLVSVEFMNADGAVKKIPVNQLLLDIKTGKTLPKSVRFRFTGSVLIQPDPNKPAKEYAADSSGTLIAIFPVTNETVMQSTLSMKDEKYVKLETDKKMLPKEGTPVKLILEVAK